MKLSKPGIKQIDKTKKRKLSEMKAGAPGSTAGSKVTVVPSGTSATGSKAVKKIEVKDAKTDSSFFSTSKPKKALPSFSKNKPAPSTAGATGGNGGKEGESIKVEAAQPSNENAFELALKEMSGKRSTATRPTSASSTPVPTSAAGKTSAGVKVESRSGTETPPPGPGRPGKRRRVTWAPEGELEKVKIIEPAVYDDDGTKGVSFISLVV